MKYRYLLPGAAGALLAGLLTACDPFDQSSDYLPEESASPVSLEEVAQILSSLPLGPEQLGEVYDAASASAGNGYDEEYRMQDLFAAPGSGVGGSPAGTKAYTRPLRDLLREAVQERFATKAEDRDPSAWLEALSGSDVQIYWPFSASWDGRTLPIVTFDPGGEATANEGYRLREDGTVEKLLVTEEMAASRPVWVVNRNSDAGYPTLELLRREDPDWGSGGEIVVGTKADTELRTLVLRSFTAHRQFDSWLSGGSEFFVKMGAVEDFSASTEAELRLYEPSITDFMIVVRRNQVEEEVPFNAILVSEWTGMLESCAFMITEDDGGTRTSWKCSATVKYNSKSYGFEFEIPLNNRDDIVWRGNLSRGFIEKASGTHSRFGDVSLVLELI